jgi:nicotinamide riboside kinase
MIIGFSIRVPPTDNMEQGNAARTDRNLLSPPRVPMLKIAIVGPESSGKTVLTEALSAHYAGGCVAEPSRAYLERIGRPYNEHDLLAIARELEHLHAELASLDGPMFYDTDSLNLRIWGLEKYGRVHPEIDRMVREVHYTWRLLCRPDIPWEPDPFRENPHDRDRLFTVWERELRTLGLPYTIIEGTHEQRMRTAIEVVDGLVAGRVGQ